ncbi:chaperone modulator CbpM [Salinisphaera hydrothermalis]|uniref:MerR family transcriptional regulator n=1 Tax=Salinisphaera hydrothermalis (strain C41B8) TaxID=1304275 RepID=A0A084IJB5_SALHC|nr:chaperone modulator CbpM [Salinisphaera hydrothermalis]KEZ76799.1 MerR family transcriptional regulator [Salinisphaera hydrothermalis C41B8]
MQDTRYTLTCEIVEHGETLTLAQLCRSCGVHAEWITLLVEHGVLEPVSPNERQWRFAAAHLPRVHTARRLAQDLELNASGIALALELMDEIRTLRGRLAAQEARDEQR